MFEDDKLYFTDDPLLLQIAPSSTMATWRSEGRGPAFHKMGRRVTYLGRDLNEWVAQHRVATADQPAAAA